MSPYVVTEGFVQFPGIQLDMSKVLACYIEKRSWIWLNRYIIHIIYDEVPQKYIGYYNSEFNPKKDLKFYVPTLSEADSMFGFILNHKKS